MTVKIWQGDSYPLYFSLYQENGDLLTPALVDEVEVCFGSDFRKTYSDGGVLYDADTGMWYVHPTQQETHDLGKTAYAVIVGVKYKSQSLIGHEKAGTLVVRHNPCKEVM